MADDDAPQDPITSLGETFAHMHEMFLGMRDAGFTEWQACRIIGVWIAESGRQS